MNSRSRVLIHIMGIFVFLAGFLAAAPVSVGHAANTITVTNGSDSGMGSLREAIALASPGDTIDFSGDMTVTLASELVIGQNLTLSGAGYVVIIDGNHATRVLKVSGGNVTLDHITIANGKVHYMDCGGTCNVGAGMLIQNASAVVTVTNSTFAGNWIGPGGSGGGIENWATLTVANSTFSDNEAYYGSGGGIRNRGTLTVTESTFSDNFGYTGGGISNSGTLAVAKSTFSGNSAEAGGGITNAGESMLTNSTFSGNRAPVGGGVSNSGTLLVANSTFYGNSAGHGGAISNSAGSTLTLMNSTFSANRAPVGGGIYGNMSTLTATNSIIADCSFYESTIAGGHNIETGATSCGFPADSMSVTDPMLGPLQDNGGPTMTMALLPGSPAIDAGDDASCPATDQRGVTRPQGSRCDIGAFEVQVTYSFSGFLPPTENPPAVNAGKAGKAYPIKWQLKDANGSYVNDLTAISSISYKSTSCSAFTGDETGAVAAASTGGTGLRYDSASNQFVYNWAAPSKGCYTFFLSLKGGQVFSAYFNLSK